MNEYFMELSFHPSSNGLFKFMQFNLVLLLFVMCGRNTNTHVNLDLIVLKCAPFFIEMTMHFYVLVVKQCIGKLIGDLVQDTSFEFK